MEIRKENLKLAVLALGGEVSLTEDELLEAIQQKVYPAKTTDPKPKVYRRGELPDILGVSLRTVDRLITTIKKNGKIISKAVLPTVQISKKAVGVLDKDVEEYLRICRRD